MLSLAAGKIDVGRVLEEDNGVPFITNPSVTSTGFTVDDHFILGGTGGYILSGTTSSMIVPDGGKAISLTVSPPVSGVSEAAGTGTIDSSTLQQKLHFLPFGMGYVPQVLSITTTGAVSPTSPRTLVIRSENP